MTVFTQAYFRFYGELKDFLSEDRKRKTFAYVVKGHPSIKDTLEALGVPHTEIAGILVNARGVDFSYQVQHEDRVAIYSWYTSAQSHKFKRLRPALRGRPRFVIDSHLGKLVRHLRLLGFDCIYRKTFPDPMIVRIAVREDRIVLTRDIGLLKNKAVTRGCWIRSTESLQQLREVFHRYQLRGKAKPFTLCLECNGRIRRVAKSQIFHHLPPLTKIYYHRFYRCENCKKIYWQGAHYENLSHLVKIMG